MASVTGVACGTTQWPTALSPPIRMNCRNVPETRALFQEPEEALDRDIHDLFRRFLDMGHVHHMGNSLHAHARGFSLRKIALHDFEPRLRRQRAVVAQGADCAMVEGRV